MNVEIVEKKIFVIRGHRVMLDADLAHLYEVETRALKQAVKRNLDRFPNDFMFELTQQEWDFLRSQFVILEKGRGKYPKYLPFAFTEQGVAMLSSVLKSKKALQINIAIIRVFVEIRKAHLFQTEVLSELNELKQRIGEHDAQLNSIYDAIENLLDKNAIIQKWEDREMIGFQKK